jgi:hypothetical protein
MAQCGKEPTKLKPNVGETFFRAIDEARKRYHRLVLALGTTSERRSEALTAVAKISGCRVVNLGIELSALLLDVPRKGRATAMAGEIESLIAGQHSDAVFLDRIEMLFQPELAQDPLRLLESLSRNRVVVASWPGQVDGSNLTYASPGHPEHYQRPCTGLLTVFVPEEDTVA